MNVAGEVLSRRWKDELKAATVLHGMSCDQ